MKPTKFERIQKYFVLMTFVVEVLKQGIIDKDDYLNMEKYLADKFGIEENSIYRLHYKID